MLCCWLEDPDSEAFKRHIPRWVRATGRLWAVQRTAWPGGSRLWVGPAGGVAQGGPFTAGTGRQPLLRPAPSACACARACGSRTAPPPGHAALPAAQLFCSEDFRYGARGPRLQAVRLSLGGGGRHEDAGLQRQPAVGHVLCGAGGALMLLRAAMDSLLLGVGPDSRGQELSRGQHPARPRHRAPRRRTCCAACGDAELGLSRSSQRVLCTTAGPARAERSSSELQQQLLQCRLQKASRLLFSPPHRPTPQRAAWLRSLRAACARRTTTSRSRRWAGAARTSQHDTQLARGAGCPGAFRPAGQGPSAGVGAWLRCIARTVPPCSAGWSHRSLICAAAFHEPTGWPRQ